MHHDVKMRHDDEVQGGRFLLGVVCGAAIGAAVGILLAPRSGADLRGQISEGAQRFGRQAAEAANRASSTINEMVSRGRAAAEHGRETVNDLVERGRDAAERGRESFEDVRANFARASIDS